MSYCRLLFYLISFLLSAAASAQVNFQKYCHYSPADTILYQHIDRQTFTLMRKDQQSPPFNNKGVYWFRLCIENKHPEQDLIINISSSHLDSVFLFQNINGKIAPTDTSGNDLRHKEHVSLRHVRFRVDGNTTVVWLKTHLKKDMLFPVTVDTVQAFNRAEHLIFLRMGLYYGFVLTVLVINIIFYFGFEEPKFLYYSVFLLLIALLFAYADGLYAFVSSNRIWLNYGNLPIQLGATIAGAVFSANLLELKHHIYLRRASIILITLTFICYTAHMLFGGTAVLLIGNLAGPLLFGLYWLAALFRFKTDTLARFFVFAYGLSLLLAFDHIFFKNMGWSFVGFLPGKLKFTNILQMIILSLGIVHRARNLQKEHAYYRDEIQRHLNGRSAEKLKENENPPGPDVFMLLQEQFGLSEREIDVLKLLSEGYTNQQIGEMLYLSSNTVKFHIRNIYLKMDINNRTQAVSMVHQASY